MGKRKWIALLVDPDKFSEESEFLRAVIMNPPDIILVGGSLITSGNVDGCVTVLRRYLDVPMVLFPGSQNQFTEAVDALLFLTLISGRNADLLIGQHVQAAPRIAASGVEVIPTGYILIDGGVATSASYISQTAPIPGNKPEIAATTALAGALLGLRCIYLDAGSGAIAPVSASMISAVKKSIDIPLMVGGGLRTIEAVQTAFNAGADIIVVGTMVEERPDFLAQIIHFKQSVFR